jgi:hypothetical protein
MTPYQYTYQNPLKFIDPTGMKGEEIKEPPIKGISYFKDNSGEYFWNYNKDSYEHYTTGQDGYSYYKGTYSANEFKEPIGDYEIIFDLSGLKQPDEFNSKYTIDAIAMPTLVYLELKGNLKDISERPGYAEKYPGVRIFSSPEMNGALTAGNIIITNPYMEGINTLDHEYGHYLDFKYNFKFTKSEYIKTIAIPSVFSAIRATIRPDKYDHHDSFSEKRADILGRAWTGNKSLYKN